MPTLEPGQPAPDLDLVATDGARYTLRARRGRRVLVAFLRNAQCAVCNLWVHGTSALAPGWRDQGLDVLAVFEATDASLRAQLDGRAPPFPVLADPDGAAHDAFGSRTDPARVAAVIAAGTAERFLANAAAAGFQARREPGSNFFRLPAEVLVREDGTVARVHVAEDVGDHLSADVIARFARGQD